jgi:hypothetical protein
VSAEPSAAAQRDASPAAEPDVCAGQLAMPGTELLVPVPVDPEPSRLQAGDASAQLSLELDATAPRLCAWCRGEIPAQARRDSICCSKRCRQARHRFTTAVGRGVAADVPLRLAYADPPYPGLSGYYRDHPDYAGEVGHADLIERLGEYDGWALSTSAAALPAVLALCPPGVAVAAWHKGERPRSKSLRPLAGWEPVIYSGGRAIMDEVAPGEPRRVDSLVYPAKPRLTDPGRVIGAKPAVFCRWVFDLLGARVGDDFTDLFPGSGGVARAWATYTEEVG